MGSNILKKNFRILRSRAKKYFSLGARGERATAQYLKRNGFLLWEMNWRCKRGEIDIIASRGRTLFFVEVKSRDSKVAEYFAPASAVDDKKLQHLSAAAQWYWDSEISKRRRTRIMRYNFLVASVIARRFALLLNVQVSER